MASQILINDTKAQSQSGPQMFRAGSTISDAATQAAIAAEGGLLWPATDATVAAAAVIVQKLRKKGANEELGSAAMLAAAINSLNQGVSTDIQTPQAISSGSLAEVAIAGLVGQGNIVGAYYVPNVSSAPASGSNSQVILLNIYDQTGTLVGQLASATLNNANQMTKWVRF